jgi:hypothetical protein
LAQRMLLLLRDTVGGTSRDAAAALEWATDQREWLWPHHAWAEADGESGDKLDWQSLVRLAGEIDTTEQIIRCSPGFAGRANCSTSSSSIPSCSLQSLRFSGCRVCRSCGLV